MAAVTGRQQALQLANADRQFLSPTSTISAAAGGLRWKALLPAHSPGVQFVFSQIWTLRPAALENSTEDVAKDAVEPV